MKKANIMVFAKSDLTKVATLARLSLRPEEMNHLESDLDRIVNFVAQLREVNVDGIIPMSHAEDRSLSFRDDIAGETLGRECIKSSAGYEDGLIRVPKIIE
jgi:aspartyl-tRNA(Asn)/glutamyl-tRNA(Gln) amidotransferase subunit C